LLKVVSFLKLI